ncbi:hypothetical protein LZ009_16970 [Ramlibacter sp. XY19]|uniref:hypothetical protein n=1 Tax=Ramlibacter paludis TaxID=2908000 RepID=UPI0023D9CBAF|nr:hypothetical protein [Ramlibacter paludis]MCG2594472.1 hypothetical protein [Ramlibacter paludis]
MNRISKPLLAAVVAVGALAATTAAQARSDVVLSIGVNAPYGYVQPQPVYVQPQPVYMEPQPVYVQPRAVYVQPQTVYYEQRGYYRHHRHHGAWRDADRDGVPNRYDRAPNNPYRY